MDAAKRQFMQQVALYQLKQAYHFVLVQRTFL